MIDGAVWMKRFFIAAAEAGQAEPQSNMGGYRNGEGVTRDDQLADYWLARAREALVGGWSSVLPFWSPGV